MIDRVGKKLLYGDPVPANEQCAVWGKLLFERGETGSRPAGPSALDLEGQGPPS